MTRANQLAVDDRKTALGSPRRKLLLASVLLAAACGVLAWFWIGESGRGRAVSEADARISVTCSQCQQQFEMPFSEYQALSPLGTDVTGPIRCPRCGAEGAVTRYDVSVVSPTIPMSGGDLASGAAGAEQDEEGAGDDGNASPDIRRPAKVSAE